MPLIIKQVKYFTGSVCDNKLGVEDLTVKMSTFYVTLPSNRRGQCRDLVRLDPSLLTRRRTIDTSDLDQWIQWTRSQKGIYFTCIGNFHYLVYLWRDLNIRHPRMTSVNPCVRSLTDSSVCLLYHSVGSLILVIFWRWCGPRPPCTSSSRVVLGLP